MSTKLIGQIIHTKYNIMYWPLMYQAPRVANQYLQKMWNNGKLKRAACVANI